MTLRTFGSLVKFSHTIFALPFALSMFVVVHRIHPATAEQLVWILICMVSARTAAMAYNRYLDSEIDSKNPRTVNREIPTGMVRKGSALLLALASAALFLVGSAYLGMHCLFLAPLVLFVLLFYSWTKRFTSWSHFVLGLSLALAPGGVWYALTGVLSWPPVVLMAAVLLWVAGFDLLYSCQDVEFDRAFGLHSVPARIGIRKALMMARMLHIFSACLLFVFGYIFGLGIFYYVGAGLFSLLLMSQHHIVGRGDLSRINEAFFVRNGAASVLFFLFVLFDSYWR